MYESEDDESRSESPEDPNVSPRNASPESESAESLIPARTIVSKVPLSTLVFLERPSIEVVVEKITIRFQPIGLTPAINPRVFKIASNQSIATLGKFLKRKLRNNGGLHLYVQNSFLPNPDEVLGDLYDLFKTGNELIISYCYDVAFG